MASLAELKEKKRQLDAQQKQLDEEIRKAEVDARQKAESDVEDKLLCMSDAEKHWLLSHMTHDRASCSDENPTNGYSYANNRWYCRKCMLMQMLAGDHGGKFDFDIDVSIHRTII